MHFFYEAAGQVARPMRLVGSSLLLSIQIVDDRRPLIAAFNDDATVFGIEGQDTVQRPRVHEHVSATDLTQLTVGLLTGHAVSEEPTRNRSDGSTDARARVARMVRTTIALNCTADHASRVGACAEPQESARHLARGEARGHRAHEHADWNARGDLGTAWAALSHQAVNSAAQHASQENTRDDGPTASDLRLVRGRGGLVRARLRPEAV